MIPDFRKLLDDAKQRRVHMELTFEQLPEILFQTDSAALERRQKRENESRRRRQSGRYPGEI